MNKKRIFAKVLSIVAAAALTAFCALPVSAADTATDNGTGTANGSVNINGTILPLTISVTHQITVDYTLDPNNGNVTADPITVTNDTRVPINVTVQSLASAPGGDLTFTDVGPNDKNWSELSCTDSKQFIALGLHITDSTGWNGDRFNGTSWAAAKQAVKFGSLPSGATGKITLTAKSGLAFDGQYSSKANVVLMINLF